MQWTELGLSKAAELSSIVWSELKLKKQDSWRPPEQYSSEKPPVDLLQAQTQHDQEKQDGALEMKLYDKRNELSSEPLANEYPDLHSV